MTLALPGNTHQDTISHILEHSFCSGVIISSSSTGSAGEGVAVLTGLVGRQEGSARVGGVNGWCWCEWESGSEGTGGRAWCEGGPEADGPEERGGGRRRGAKNVCLWLVRAVAVSVGLWEAEPTSEGLLGRFGVKCRAADLERDDGPWEGMVVPGRGQEREGGL